MIELLGAPVRKELIADLEQKIKDNNIIEPVFIYNPASFEASSYIAMIRKLCDKLGLKCIDNQVASFEETQEKILEANKNPKASIFLARPLMFKGEKELISLIDEDKDADMLTYSNSGHLVQGDINYLPGTASSVNRLLDYYHIECEGKKCLIIGRSISVGMPISLMMIKRNALVSVVHSRIKKETIKQYAAASDIIVLCSGQRGLIEEKDLSSSQVIIDCGYLEDGKGDLGFVPSSVAAFTPVPGGVGPLTIASLLSNAYFLKK